MEQLSRDLGLGIAISVASKGVSGMCDLKIEPAIRVDSFAPQDQGSHCRFSELRSHAMTALRKMTTHVLKGATSSFLIGLLNTAFAEQPPAPCHPNPNAADDRETVAKRGDIANLPKPLKDQLIRWPARTRSILPLQVFAETDPSSQLFQYYLLDSTGFEPNVLTKIFPGVNDHAQVTATG